MTTWVLLRGWTREAGHWGAFPDAFGAGIDAASVLCVDLPGCGTRRGERSPAHVEAIVESCRAVLRERGVAPPVHLLAMSLGAMVAIAWSTRHPEEVEGAVLVNTSVRGFGAWYRRLNLRQSGRLLSAFLSRDAEKIERNVLAMTSRRPRTDADALVSRWVAIRRERPVSRGNALRQLWAAARFRAPMPPPRVPLLVLASRRDGLVDPRCSERMAAAWNAPLAIHASAGHDLPLDDPEWVIAETAHWLAGAWHSAAPRDRRPAAEC